MKKMYQKPWTEKLDWLGDMMVMFNASDIPLNPVGSSIGAPQRATKLYV